MGAQEFCLAGLTLGQKSFVMAALVVMMTVVTVLHLSPFVALGRLWRLSIEQVGLYFGPKWVCFRLCSVPICIGLFPGGGYVKFAGQSDFGPPDEVPPGLRRFTDLTRLQQAAICLSGPAMVLLVSMFALGPGAAWPAFLATVEQWVRGSLSPRAVAGPLLRDYLAAIADRRLLFAFGLLAAKFAMLNALPLPIVNGGQALICLLDPRRKLNRLWNLLSVLALLVFAAAAVMWGYALVLVLWS